MGYIPSFACLYVKGGFLFQLLFYRHIDVYCLAKWITKLSSINILFLNRICVLKGFKKIENVLIAWKILIRIKIFYMVSIYTG